MASPDKTSRKKHTVIIGAGPAGMACAMELHKAKKPFILVEKSKYVGGLSKTYTYKKFRFDNGPHRFFSKNKYLHNFIKDLLAERWITVKRSTRFYIKGRFYRWPIDPVNVLTTLPPRDLFFMIRDFVYQKMQFWRKRQPKNFEEYVVRTFGQKLAEFNMLDYNEKIWGIAPSQMSVDWSMQRIKDLSLFDILQKIVVKNGKARTIIDQFYYPVDGTGLIYETIKKKIERTNTVLLKTVPLKLVHEQEVITRTLLSNKQEIVPVEYVVSSMPVTKLVELLSPRPPKDVLTAAQKLRYRSQVYLFLTINKHQVSPDQWIYFPDKEIPFGRISEMKNFSSAMAPKDKTSLLVEYFCWEDDKVWKMSQKSLEKLTVSWLEKLGFIKKDEVLETVHLKQSYTYPVYDLTYKKNLDIVLAYLDSFKNLITIGRPGRFKYTNQDHSLEMGIIAAHHILGHETLDLDNIGGQQEFFEKGKLYE